MLFFSHFVYSFQFRKYTEHNKQRPTHKKKAATNNNNSKQPVTPSPAHSHSTKQNDSPHTDEQTRGRESMECLQVIMSPFGVFNLLFIMYWWKCGFIWQYFCYANEWNRSFLSFPIVSYSFLVCTSQTVFLRAFFLCAIDDFFSSKRCEQWKNDWGQIQINKIEATALSTYYDTIPFSCHLYHFF